MLYSKFKLSILIFVQLLRLSRVMLLGLTLASCSVAPVYFNQSGSAQNLIFAQPNSRLEQIVYSDLIGYFGQSRQSNARLVSIRVSSSPITPGSGSIGLSGTISVTEPDQLDSLFSGVRTASATYISSNQRLANQQAANEASERAAHALAQTIRVTLLSVLTSSNAK